jgi:hypothetical protein
MCDSPYFGEWCQYKHCLNNCSFPNGDCDILTGECVCQSVYNPYNKSRRLVGEDWNASYQGIDCSYLTAFAKGSKTHPNIPLLLFLITMLLILMTSSSEK